MRRSTSHRHPNDEAILAYLDGELPGARAHSVRAHLKICWKCGSVLADLESQAETISRLLSVQLDSDLNRSGNARERFLRWRASSERKRKLFFRSQFSLLDDIVQIAVAR